MSEAAVVSPQAHGAIAKIVVAIAVVLIAVLGFGFGLSDAFSATGCTPDIAIDDLQGITRSDSGDGLAVVFRLPEGASLEDVLGSGIGSKHQMAVSVMGSMDTSVENWATVDTGGLVVWWGGLCCYSPSASASSARGYTTPPAYMIFLKVPDESDVFRPEDVGELEKRYGIVLNL